MIWTTRALDADSRLQGPPGAAENWKLLQYFSLYRLLLAAGALAIALIGRPLHPFGETAPTLFLTASLIYFTITLAGLVTARRRWPDFETQTSLYAFADIVLLTLLMHASGGLASGLGLLLLISVANSGLLLPPRLAIFFAALASLVLLSEHFWSVLYGGRAPYESLAQVGLLGFFLFATAGLFHTLARRLRATEALARRRGIDLANLELVNEFVIQRLPSGVLVCDRNGQVHRMNRAACELLGQESGPARQPLRTLSPPLAAQFDDWLRSRAPSREKPFSVRNGRTLLARFAAIGERQEDSGVLVLLEDSAVLQQQAQQVKLAALARLTASIAHEIRNPLGAVMQAAQLLAESPAPTPEEKRLVRIIEDQGRRMNEMIENVLQLARRDRIRPVRLALRPWLEGFTARFAEDARLPPAALAVEAADRLEACMDPDQLYQVVYNLCQNAVRHSPVYDGHALVALRAGVDRDRRPFLEVADRGSGVAPEIVDNIFEPFFTTAPKGSGLGLYLARQLCEGNGARLDYRPGENGGSCFRISFTPGEECPEHEQP
jgi:two-component system sensor histidine kinase PilS (NtrC family)